MAGAPPAQGQWPTEPTAPTLRFSDPQQQATLGQAYAAAVHNLLTVNTVPYARATTATPDADYNQTGLLRADPGTFLRAGAGYQQPWTRDASVNSWNAASLLEPAVARNTLLSVLRRQADGTLTIQQDNQWWDQVIWITAAWNHFLVTGDREFLGYALEAAQSTLARNRATHFNAQFGLYEGPAFLNDGIAGYPAPPADATESRGSFVLDYPGADKLMVLSTNCLYVNALRTAAQMAEALGAPPMETTALREEADTLVARLHERLWLPAAGRFGYFLTPAGTPDRSQESAGLAFALLFGVATPAEAASIRQSVHREPEGVVDVYPSFPRYSDAQPGRHNVVVWPPISAFWAEALLRGGDLRGFGRDTAILARLVTGGDGHFWEIYNARTGVPDGGWQVGHHWSSEQDQTWSASGYLRLLFGGVFGMQFGPAGLLFTPNLPPGWGEVTVSNVRYREAVLAVSLRGSGSHVQQVLLDGKVQPTAEIPATLLGPHVLSVELRP